MSQCPNCQKQIDVQEKHFGALFTCASCQAVYFINFEGQPEYDPNPPAYIPQAQEVPIELGANSQVSAAAEEMGNLAMESLNGDIESNNSFDLPVEAPPLEAAPEEIPGIDTSDMSFGVSDDVMPEVVETPVPTEDLQVKTITMPPSRKQKTGDPLKEIVEFANSSEAGTSGVEYNLKISGIDSKALFDAVKEALEDSRFMWDLEKVLAEIKDGELVLKKISPVKASLVASRLRFKEVQITWEQNEI